MKIVVKAKTIDPVERKPPDQGSMEFVGEPAREGFAVYLEAMTHHEMLTHGREDLYNELGGVLVGEFCCNGDEEFIDIQGYIPAHSATSRAASLEFNHEAWQEVHKGIEENFPDSRILGWYHTHPGYGIFLSGMDLFIDNNWFTQRFHVAAVFDPTLPIPEGLGVFVWSDENCERRARSGYVIYEAVDAGEDQAVDADQPGDHVADEAEKP